jgi:hypothetical protein
MSVLRFPVEIFDHGDAAVAVSDAGDQRNIEFPPLLGCLQFLGDVLAFAE